MRDICALKACTIQICSTSFFVWDTQFKCVSVKDIKFVLIIEV